MISLKKYLLLLSAAATLFPLYSAAEMIAGWNFNGSDPLKGEYPLHLRGKTTCSGQGLVIPHGEKNAPGGAAVSGKFPALTPANAFEITADVILDGAGRPGQQLMIYDSKYVAMPRSPKQQHLHKGFMFFLAPRGNNIYRLGGAFGYGRESAQAFSKDITLKPQEKHTLSMEFTAVGKLIFRVNGKPVGTAAVPAGNIAVPEVITVLGDRVGANYFPLGGTIWKLELHTAKYTPLDFAGTLSKRRVFERGEKNGMLHIELQNFLNKELKDITIHASDGAKKLPAVQVKKAAAKSVIQLKFPIDTYLLPGDYKLTLSAVDKSGKTIAGNSVEYTIVPSYGDFLPVLLWGNLDDFKAVRKYGFTHQLVHLFPRMGNFDEKTLKRWMPHLDANLKEGLYTFGTLHSHFRYLQAKRYLRTDKNGKPYPRPNLEASHPDVHKEFAEAARTTVEAVGKHPAFDGALINSEVRDGSFPSFGSGVEPAAFRKFSGYDIPETVSGKTPAPWQGNTAFPWDRVIPDDHKDLFFLRWFWDTGDGWNPLQSLLSETMHKAMKGSNHAGRFFTFYDPATRVPPMWGSGGNVDMISQWTYAYPDPIKIGQATDEVIAMAQGKPGQKIGSMTQAIWYRSQTAPANKTVKNPPEWLKWEKNAMFITPSPDSLREAFWSKISRRLDYIMYHGVGSLVTRTDHKLYRLTNWETRDVLRELNNTVIVPLGPTLKKIPERPLEVAILESVAASFYAPKHFPMGWSKGWSADLHLALQWGHFQPGIVYDEHLLNNRNIEKLKVLFVPGLEVVTAPVLKKLNELRSKGIIIIGDEFTTPALMVDFRIRSITRNTLDPAGTKKELQKLGAELAATLNKYAPRSVIASNQDLVVRQRGDDRADYVFVVNDKRTFGNYIGQWGLVQEKGLPNRGTIQINHPAAAAYDTAAHREIKLQNNGKGCSFEATLPPGGGMMVLLLDKPIGKLSLKVPSKVKRGDAFILQAEIASKDGTLFKTVLPAEVTITAADGTKLPGSGSYALNNGKLTLRETMAPNTPVGKATVQLHCFSSGKKIEKTMEIY